MEPGPDVLVWKALADPTRRHILDALREAPQTTTRLVELFTLSRFAVMKHLDVLAAAGLITVDRRGRERWNHLNVAPIRRIHRRWLRPFEAVPNERLLRLQGTLPP